ncbi:type II toxin-antitoxin system RelE/ParE family toxin [Otariodibacter sp.]|uniref:type II toxin-antitoxin system RelE/ParE family toxin n=1 Tax=Otariodibacter sp. TaxID=3030919 RepID=UPI002626F0BA|nr:type II toxin-antitoxin system RelE/ParE family toxin [Otariodibacter sp.]
MILSFKHKGLELFFNTGSTAGIQQSHAKKLRLQLSALNNAVTPLDMNAPNWHLHKLQGNLAEHWSITVSGNWRLTFKFNNGHAEIVDYQDYH